MEMGEEKSQEVTFFFTGGRHLTFKTSMTMEEIADAIDDKKQDSLLIGNGACVNLLNVDFAKRGEYEE
jgi:hypothetical protein